MKIKTIKSTHEEVLALPRAKHKKPIRPNIFFRTLLRLVTMFDLKKAHFRYTFEDKKTLEPGPYFILMNHSSFIDLEIASSILYPAPMNIVCTTDGFVGKAWLMRRIGCIPTQKFVSDLSLIHDIQYALRDLKSNVLMFPEAGYSFDGRATLLPRRLGALLKSLGVPVLFIKTEGAFARDPLYNCLQKRKVKVSASVKCILTREEANAKSVEEIDKILDECFDFDNFDWQYKNNIRITEPFRADGLERVLYKCAHCGAEGATKGEGIDLHCSACGKTYTLGELGRLEAKEGVTEYPHIPDWYDWERKEVRREILEGTYSLDTKVEIGMLVDYRGLYMVGEGRLVHDKEGFRLYDREGALLYEQKPLSAHTLNSDYFWYEIGDVIGIGNRQRLYYCFPKGNTPVAKTRLATEELFKLAMEARRLSEEEKKEA